MMLYPAMNELLEKVPSRYQLVNVVAPRARKIPARAEQEDLMLEDKPVSIAIREIADGCLDELEEEPPRGTPAIIAEKLASMACKSAVKGNMRISTKEMEALLDQLLSLENPYHCPHGRPTIITMSKYELEKKFKRIV